MNNSTKGNKIEMFSSEEFGSVRSLKIDDKPYFVARDIAKALGYSNISDAISRHCRGVVKHDTLTKGGNQTLSFIPEGDIYRLIMKSKLPKAEQFESWVCDEVLPNLRKNDMYIKEEKLAEMLSQPDNLIKILENYNKEKIKNEKLQKEISEIKPKAQSLDNIAGSFKFKDMNSTAKALGVGRNTLMELLRRKKILISKLSNKNQPYEKYIQSGYFTVKVREFVDKDGEIKLFYQPMVTNKGLVWLENKINNEWNDEIENKKLKMANEN